MRNTNMKNISGIRFSTFLAAMIVSVIAQAYPGENVMLNSAGDYVITYWNTDLEPPGLETTTFITSTKIVPTVQSRFSIDRAGSIVYRYTISNGIQAKQVLGLIIFDPVDSVIGTRDDRGIGKWGTAADTAADAAARRAALLVNEAALATPVGWDGSVMFGAGVRTDSTLRIGWDPTYNLALEKDGEGIKPGSTVRGFGFSSYALPDIIVAELTGDAPPHGWSGEGPDESSAIYNQIEQIIQNDYVSRNVAVPSIPVPVPYDAAVLLDSIRARMLAWSGKQLLGPTFATQLDSHLVAAASAFRNNQPNAGREQIESVRKMLEHEHYYLDHDDEDHEETAEHKAATRLTIDRLAARVLDFDLRYVLKRTEHEHEHDEGDRRKER